MSRKNKLTKVDAYVINLDSSNFNRVRVLKRCSFSVYGKAHRSRINEERRDSCINCTCIASSPGAIYNLDCDPNNINNGYVPVLINNTYYLDSGVYSFPCDGQHWDLSTAQSHGIDIGTVQLPSPSPTELLDLVTAFVNAQLKR